MGKKEVTRGYKEKDSSINIIEDKDYVKFIAYTEKLNTTYKNMSDAELTRHIGNWLKGRKHMEQLSVSYDEDVVFPEALFMENPDSDLPFDEIGEDCGILWFNPMVDGIKKVGVWGGSTERDKEGFIRLNANYAKRIFGKSDVKNARNRLYLINMFDAFTLC
jgi:hypothetical protein